MTRVRESVIKNKKNGTARHQLSEAEFTGYFIRYDILNLIIIIIIGVG